MTAVALFVNEAMNPELDGWDQDDGLGPDEFEYQGEAIQLGSVAHLDLVAEATGADSEYLPLTIVDMPWPYAYDPVSRRTRRLDADHEGVAGFEEALDNRTGSCGGSGNRGHHRLCRG